MKKQLPWRRALLSVTIVGSLVLSACSSSDGEEGGDAVVTYAEHQAFDSLYPPSAGFYPNGGVVNNITDRLLYQNPETLELEPWIATELPEINEDATEYTFKIREGVTYSDGSELTAANVVKNFDLYGQGDQARTLTVSEAINNYDRGEVVDESTVKFYFTAPAPGFAQATSTINSGLLSDATLDRSQEEFGPGNGTEIAGSGPFVIAQEKLGTELLLEAREDYDWAPPSLAKQGRADIDAVNILVTPEDSVRIGAVISGQADIARQISAPEEQRVSDAGVEVVAKATNGVNNGFSFRFGHPLLSDIRVRQAIIAGVDREALVEELFSENYPIATSTLAENALGYSDQSDNYVFDPQRAAELLDEAGWVVGSDGIREKDGQRLSIRSNEALPQPRSKDVITLVAQQLREIGVELEINPGDQASQTADSRDINTIQIYHSMVARADYDVIKSQYHSANRNSLLNTTEGTTFDPELDRLLEAVASEPVEADRIAATQAVQDYLSENAYILPFFEEPQVYAVRSNIEGFSTESVARPSFYALSISE